MLRLGSIVLTALLTGLPRALDARAFGRAPSVYVEVSPDDPELASFAEDLERALAAAACPLAPSPARATLVLEIHRLARSDAAEARVRHALLLSLDDGRSRRPILVDHRPRQRAQAARALLDALPGPAPTTH